MVDAIKYTVGVTCLLIALGKFFRYRQGEPNPKSIYTIACVFLLGLTSLAIAPATLHALHSIEPLPNLSRWVGNSLGIAAGFCISAILEYTVRELDQARRRVTLYIIFTFLVITLMGFLLVAGQTTQFTADFVAVYGNRPPIAAYYIIFSAYIAWVLVNFIKLLRKYSAGTIDKTLSTGLFILTLGSITGLAWAVWKPIILFINAIRGSEPLMIEASITALLSSLTTIFLSIGMVIPIIVRGIIDPLRRRKITRSYRALEPLWTALHEALPEIKFTPNQKKIDNFSLYRRAIEIRDGHLILRSYFHPQVKSWVVAETPKIINDQVEILVEASLIAGALEAYAAGVRYHSNPADAEAPDIGTGDMDSEIAWLVRVSQAFSSSRIVHKIRQQVHSEIHSRSSRQC